MEPRDESARRAREIELDLVARLRASDSEAFDAVHATFNGRLFNFLARLSRRRDVAEDLLEETWLRVVDKAPQLRPDTRLGPFLFTVARNLYVSYCRSRALEESLGADMIGLWPLGTPRPSPFDATVANETGQQLEIALAALPALYREALLLVAFDDLRPVDAALVCGITPDAMRQRLSRARAMLAKKIDELQSSHLTALKEATT
jgi:RNA polymerase sigma-70 factor (ECF subfamily)